MKKNIKRLVAVLVVMAMIISLCSTAFAAPRGNNKSSRGNHKGWTKEVTEETTVADPVVEETTETATEDQAVEDTAETAPEEATVEEATEETVDETTEEAVSEETEESVEIAEETVIEYPAATFDSINDVEGITVHVEAPENALPAGTTMEVTEVKLDAVQDAVDKADDITGTVVAAVDITFFDADSEPVEPEKDITVTMTSDKIAETTDPKVVHVDVKADEIEDADVEAEKVNDDKVTADDDAVTFDADQFSVYAVVDPGETGDNARLTVNFINGNNTIATMYVKTADLTDDSERTADEKLAEILYDPGVGTVPAGQLFNGWKISSELNSTDGSSYTADTPANTIKDVRDHVKGLSFKEGDVLNVYAMIMKVYSITYLDPKGISIGSENVLLPVSETEASYTINRTYTVTDTSHSFVGWLTPDGANIVSAKYDGENVAAPYEKDTELVIKGSVNLRASAPEGYWLVFDEVLKDATYNAPQFYENNVPTSGEKVLDMACVGYEFEGWYYGEKSDDGTVTYGDEFSFGSPLTANTTIYAKWKENTTANYTVIVWYERMEDTYANNVASGSRNYDFYKSYTMTGNTGATINAVSNGSSSASDADGTSYYNARIRGTDKDGRAVDETIAITGYHRASYDTDVTIKADGTSVVNVYYDRNTVTYTFYTWQTGYTYTQTTGNNGTQYGLIDGEYVELTRETNYTYTPTTGNNGTQYGLVDGEYVQLTRHGRNNYYWTYGDTMWSEGTRYTGTRYTRTANGYTWYYNGTEYTETRYTRSNAGSSWQQYQYEIGLYGESLNWPENTNIWWYPNGGNNGSTSGTRMTYKSDFIPVNTDMSVEYYGSQQSGSGTVIFYTQTLQGSNNYQEAARVSSAGGGFNINDKFTGFTAAQWRTGGSGSWNNVGELMEVSGSYYYDAYPNQSGYQSIPGNNTIEIRFNRISGTITFMDGQYFDGSGINQEETPRADEFKISQSYYYQASIASYNKNGADYYVPTCPHTGYTFDGWYADDSCTIPYNFTTMPATGVTVYAKWIKNQYRVFLHPNVPETDTSLNWGTDQGMNFRVDFGGKISAPTGLRKDYEMIGWFTDEALTNAFTPSTVLNETTVTTPYDKTAVANYTDNMNKYGNIEASSPKPAGQSAPGYNSDAYSYNEDTGEFTARDRFWITKKYNLYAKWSEKLPGADGIGIRYVADPGTNPPTDSIQYKDNVDAVAQGASTAPAGQMFMYWVVQKWDEASNKYVDTDEIVYPGATFTVLKQYAQISDITYETDDQGDPIYEDGEPKIKSATYTMQLRAEYAPAEAETPTHITWYGNGGTLKTPVEGKDGEYDATSGEVTTSYINLQINEKVPAAPANTFERAGFKFVGWARETEPEDAFDVEAHTVNEDAFTKKEDVTLWLKLNDNGTTYSEVDAEGNVVNAEVTEVAADENAPYHALYAVWEPEYFYIYHSGTGTLEAVQIPESGTISLPAKVDTDQFLYGGYYSAFGGYTVTDADKAAALEATDKKYEVEGATAVYNADKTYVKGLTKWWKNPETADGSKLKPEANAVYYVKEVPNKYLTTRIQYVYNWNEGNKISTIYLLTVVDDKAYNEVFFTLDVEDSDDKEAALASAFTFVQRNTNDKKTTSVTDFENVTRGFVGYADGEFETGADGYIAADTEFTITPKWETPDGVIVTGSPRSFTTGADGTADTIAELD